jgi:MFS family permease
MAIFGIASAVATFCQTPGQLIAVRAVMGVGAAFLMPGTLSILTRVFDDAERKKEKDRPTVTPSCDGRLQRRRGAAAISQ